MSGPVTARAGDRVLRTRVFLSKRTLCYALGLLWLLDGALQLQSFMFTSGFANQIIAPAASGQPSFVADAVMWNARLISGHPALFDALFAAVQIALGLGFLIKRAVRPVIVASIVWAVGVWYLGEGLGGVAGPHATALVGAPGAAIIYAVLAVAAWPARSRPGQETTALDEQRPPGCIIWAWGALWVGSAFLSSLPGNVRASELAAQLTTNASSVPSWLGSIDRSFAAGLRSAGPTGVAVTVAIELAIGLAAISNSRLRSAAVYAGMMLAAVYWAVGQSFGELFSGQATDPSTGPLLMVLGLAAIGAMRVERTSRRAFQSIESQSIESQSVEPQSVELGGAPLSLPLSPRVRTSTPVGVTRSVCSN
jgi:hypothetical protein